MRARARAAFLSRTTVTRKSGAFSCSPSFGPPVTARTLPHAKGPAPPVSAWSRPEHDQSSLPRDLPDQGYASLPSPFASLVETEALTDYDVVGLWKAEQPDGIFHRLQLRSL